MKDSNVSTCVEKTLDMVSDAELDAKLQKSYAYSVAGVGRPLADVFDDLERSLK